MKCKTCKSTCAWAGKEESEHGKCLVGYTPKTNADRIRSMPDEELAEFCFCITDDVASYYSGDGYKQKYPVAPKGWLDWLRQEAKDGE